MRIAAIIVALAVSVAGVALFARAVASIVGVVTLGRPAAGRRDQPGRRWRHLLTETLGPHPDAAVAPGRRGPLARLRRLRCPLLHPGHRVRAVVRADLRTAADRTLDRVRVGQRAHCLGRPGRDRILDADPAGPTRSGSRVSLLRLSHLAGRVRRTDHRRHRGVRTGHPRDGVPAPGRADEPAALSR